MKLLKLLKTSHESNFLNRRIKKLLERIETKSCSSEEQFNHFLSELQSYIETAKSFNKINSYLSDYKIPVKTYEARLTLAKEAGMCFDTLDW